MCEATLQFLLRQEYWCVINRWSWLLCTFSAVHLLLSTPGLLPAQHEHVVDDSDSHGRQYSRGGFTPSHPQLVFSASSWTLWSRPEVCRGILKIICWVTSSLFWDKIEVIFKTLYSQAIKTRVEPCNLLLLLFYILGLNKSLFKENLYN